MESGVTDVGVEYVELTAERESEEREVKPWVIGDDQTTRLEFILPPERTKHAISLQSLRL